jgi:hypothetical protein
MADTTSKTNLGNSDAPGLVAMAFAGELNVGRERGLPSSTEQTGVHKAFTTGMQQLDPTIDR